MNRNTSVWMLLAGGSAVRLWVVLGVTAVIEAGAFAAFGRDAENFGEAVRLSRLSWICAAAFGAFCLILSLNGCQSDTRLDDTFGRLKTSGRTVFFCQCAYNTLCLLLLWGAQTTIVFLLSRWYLPLHTESAGHQGLLVDFYRNGFLHGLLPLSEWSRWTRNIVSVWTLGVLMASVPLRQRQGRRTVLPVVTAAAAALTAGGFSSMLGSRVYDFALSAILLIPALLYGCSDAKSAGTALDNREIKQAGSGIGSAGSSPGGGV